MDISRWVRRIVKFVSLPVAAVLLVFNLRRILFTLAILFHRAPLRDPVNARNHPVKDFLVLIPCRNEYVMVPGIFRSLQALDYPRQHLRMVLVDDGSTDGTAEQMAELSRECPQWSVIQLNHNAGKASALNTAIRQIPFGEVIYVLDADHRPEPRALLKMSSYFDDPQVAGVSGQTVPANPVASPSAFYAAVEGLVHQMVTMRAKDRLGLAPAVLGSNCAYRRSALQEAGGFKPGALLEDSDITLKFYQSGKKIRFAEDIQSTHQVPQTVQGYLKQHTRWGRGFNETAREQIPALLKAQKMPLAQRVELILFSAGYLDRLALLAAGGLTVLSYLNQRLFAFPRKLFYFTFLLPFIQIISVFSKQRLPAGMWLRLPLVPLFFLLDIASALRAMIETLQRLPVTWQRTERFHVESK